MTVEINWHPFLVAPAGQKADPPRSLDTREGLGDRLRSAAFAELQAKEAFLWAASHFLDAPDRLRKAWIILSRAEEKHLNWLLARINELSFNIQERTVSDQLWNSLQSCQSAREFALYMASAEERGRKAGLRFFQALSTTDPVTAQIFGKIAEEELSHIELARKYFPVETSPES